MLRLAIALTLIASMLQFGSASATPSLTARAYLPIMPVHYDYPQPRWCASLDCHP